MPIRSATLLAIAGTAAFLGSCAPLPEDDRPARIDAVRGDHQCAAPGERLAEPLVVRVLGQPGRDTFGRTGPRQPLRDVPVVFLVEGVDGTIATPPGEPPAHPTLIDPATGLPGTALHRLEVVTDASGFASVDIRLGTRNGDWRIEASTERGDKRKPIKEHFRVAAGVIKLTDSIEASVGEDVELKLRLVRRAVDGTIEPLENRVVFFRLVGQPTGSGAPAALNNRKAPTDAEGVRARLDLTLGERSGLYQVLAEVEPQPGDDPIRGILFTVRAIDWTRLALEILAGALLFLVGVRVLANGFLIVLSSQMRLLTGPLAARRVLGYLGGVLAGVTFQSSSTVNSHLTSLANGGLLDSRAALPLLAGAALGASLIPQALALDVGFLVAPLLAIGLLFLMIPRSSSASHWTGVFLGAGLVVASWTLLGDGIDTLALSELFRRDVLPGRVDFAAGFASVLVSYTAFLVIGVALGLVLRTSNLVVIAAILLASRGVIDALTATPLIVGANLGSGVNSLLRARLRARAARGIGVLVFLLNAFSALTFTALSLTPWNGSSALLWIIEWVTPGRLFHPLPENLDHHLAMAHTLFNAFGGLVMMLGAAAILRRVERRFPSGRTVEDLKPFRLDDNLTSVPSLALRQTVEEVLYLADLCQKNVAEAFDAFRYGDIELAQQVVRRGEIVAGIHLDASRYLILVGENQLSRRDASELATLQTAVSCLSRIGECAEALRELTARRVEARAEGTEEIDRDLAEVYDLIMAQFDNVETLVRRGGGREEDNAVKTIERLAKFRSRFETQWIQRLEQAPDTGDHGRRLLVQANVYQHAFELLFQVAAHLAHIAERLRILSPKRL